VSWVAQRRGWPVMGPGLVVELYGVLTLWAGLMLCVTGDSVNIGHLGLWLGLGIYLLCRICWSLARLLFGREQARAGLCRVCGYDLRATPGRCPECGHVPAGEGAM
jgi:hypothetical protein